MSTIKKRRTDVLLSIGAGRWTAQATARGAGCTVTVGALLDGTFYGAVTDRADDLTELVGFETKEDQAEWFALQAGGLAERTVLERVDFGVDTDDAWRAELLRIGRRRQRLT